MSHRTALNMLHKYTFANNNYLLCISKDFNQFMVESVNVQVLIAMFNSD